MVERSVSESVGLTVLLLCLFMVGSKDLRFTDSVIGRRVRKVMGCFAKSGLAEMISYMFKVRVKREFKFGFGGLVSMTVWYRFVTGMTCRR